MPGRGGIAGMAARRSLTSSPRIRGRSAANARMMAWASRNSSSSDGMLSAANGKVPRRCSLSAGSAFASTPATNSSIISGVTAPWALPRLPPSLP